MTIEIKQSTTTYPLVFLMVDSTDHVTGKTGLSPTVTISKAGAAFASPAGAVSEIGSGWYKVAGNATDNATLGPLILHATGAAADPVDVVYNVTARLVDDLATPTNITAATGVVLSGVTHTGAVIPTVTTLTGHTAQTGDSFARLGVPAGASVSADVAAIKSDSAAILVDTAEIGTAGAGLTALATAANLATVAGYLDTEIAAILADTNELQTDWANGGRLDLILDARASQTTADAIEADTQDIQSRLPAALTAGGNIKADALALNGDTTSAANIAKTTRAIARGTASGVPTTTSIPTSSIAPSVTVADQLKGRIVTFDADTTTAALRGQATDITANTSGGVLTVTALTTAPVSGDTFSVT